MAKTLYNTHLADSPRDLWQGWLFPLPRLLRKLTHGLRSAVGFFPICPPSAVRIFYFFLLKETSPYTSSSSDTAFFLISSEKKETNKAHNWKGALPQGFNVQLGTEIIIPVSLHLHGAQSCRPDLTPSVCFAIKTSCLLAGIHTVFYGKGYALIKP